MRILVGTPILVNSPHLRKLSKFRASKKRSRISSLAAADAKVVMISDVAFSDGEIDGALPYPIHQNQMAKFPQ